MKKRLLSLLLVLVMLAGMVPFGALAADAGDALQFDYDGDSLNVIKEDGSGFGMFAPQTGSKVTVSGDQVNVTLYTKNGTIYKGFYLNTLITDETLDEANFIGGAEYGGSPYGAYTFSLSKDYCGKYSEHYLICHIPYFFFVLNLPIVSGAPPSIRLGSEPPS